MKKTLLQRSLYLAGPAVVLIVVGLAVAPTFLAPPGIPVTAPVASNVANLAGLGASLAGALVLGGSLWWFSRKGRG